ncbi:MAG: CRTAC1 family protein [Planctomycetota bacterium]|nr:CRTAC1 family protein [Planctomycetota bacterium]
MTKPPVNKPTPDEEFVHEDDTIIGHAFKWSAIAIAGIAIVVLVVIVIVSRKTPADEIVIEKTPSNVAPLQVDEAKMPVVRFTDITTQAGIDFVHTNGATGEKLLPETMGGGVAFLDYDSDGDPDLLLVNSTHWPHEPPVDSPPTMKLYRNDGAGNFEDVTTEAGLDVSFYGMGPAIGDIDNDGDPDLFIAAVGGNRFFRNDGGVFVDATIEANLQGADEGWSSSSGFFDYDDDGDLDLFVCNYVQWSREIDIELDFNMVGVGKAYGPPKLFIGTQPYLYRNEGDGTFTEVGEDAGLHVLSLSGTPVAKSLAVTFIDANADGRIDIFVANDTTQNFLYLNQGDGTFTESGVASGVAYDPSGASTGAMGIDAAHYVNDESMAVAIGNFANEPTSFYISEGGMGFSDQSIGAGIGSPSRQKLSFGLFFFDYDLDGRIDLLQADGHLEEEINVVQAGQHYRQPAQLYWNAGYDSLRVMQLVPEKAVGDLATPIVGRGAAYADIDGDGDLDVVLTQTGGSPLLVRNDQELGHHWLRIKLQGTSSNRDAIGAWIELTAGGVTQRRQVMPTRSYLSQVERTVTFGLGEADSIESIRIVWPDGQEQIVEPDGIDRELKITQTN